MRPPSWLPTNWIVGSQHRLVGSQDNRYVIGHYVALLPGVVDGASAACLYENGEGGTFHEEE